MIVLNIYRNLNPRCFKEVCSLICLGCMRRTLFEFDCSSWLNVSWDSSVKELVNAVCESLVECSPFRVLRRVLKVSRVEGGIRVEVFPSNDLKCQKPITLFRRVSKKWHVVGFGKVSGVSVKIISDIFTESGCELGGVVAVPAGYTIPSLPSSIELFVTSHPLISHQSLIAGAKILEYVRSIPPEDGVIFIVSGGGSAAIEVIPSELEFSEILELNEILLSAPLSIHELNIVRKHFSRVKGGFLARELRTRNAVSLVFSDVPGNDLSSIASGPLVHDPSTWNDVQVIFEKLYSIGFKVPKGVRKFLRLGLNGVVSETPKQIPTDIPHFILSCNARLRELISFRLSEGGIGGEIYVHDEDVTPTLDEIKELVQRHRSCVPQTLIFGGEVRLCVKRDGGVGGRCSHTAAYLASYFPEANIICLATDGHDGNTGVSGAVIPANAFLNSHLKRQLVESINAFDTAHFLERFGFLVPSFTTYSNLMDVYILFFPYPDKTNGELGEGGR